MQHCLQNTVQPRFLFHRSCPTFRRWSFTGFYRGASHFVPFCYSVRYKHTCSRELFKRALREQVKVLKDLLSRFKQDYTLPDNISLQPIGKLSKDIWPFLREEQRDEGLELQETAEQLKTAKRPATAKLQETTAAGNVGVTCSIRATQAAHQHRPRSWPSR